MGGRMAGGWVAACLVSCRPCEWAGRHASPPSAAQRPPGCPPAVCHPTPPTLPQRPPGQPHLPPPHIRSKLFKEFAIADLSRYKEGKVRRKAPSARGGRGLPWLSGGSAGARCGVPARRRGPRPGPARPASPRWACAGARKRKWSPAAASSSAAPRRVEEWGDSAWGRGWQSAREGLRDCSVAGAAGGGPVAAVTSHHAWLPTCLCPPAGLRGAAGPGILRGAFCLPGGRWVDSWAAGLGCSWLGRPAGGRAATRPARPNSHAHSHAHCRRAQAGAGQGAAVPHPRLPAQLAQAAGGLQGGLDAGQRRGWGSEQASRHRPCECAAARGGAPVALLPACPC